MMHPKIETPNRKVLAFCTNAKGVPFGLYAAEQAARLNKDRDFDIIIFSLEPIELPQYFLDLGIRSVVLDLRDQMLSANYATRRWPLASYLWMWLPQSLSEIYDRILVLDLDVFILSHELSKFMDIDLAGHPIGSVRDITQWEYLNRPVEEFKARKIRGRKFLNSGMLLIDTKRYNELKILDKIHEVCAAGDEAEKYDQGLINLALMGEWAEVSPVWNWQWTRAYPFYHERIGPQILHFQGHRKPWSDDATQTRFSRILVNQYYMFLNQHFPDRGFESLNGEGFRRSRWAIIVDILDHLQKMPRMNRLMRRFKSDWDVLP